MHECRVTRTGLASGESAPVSRLKMIGTRSGLLFSATALLSVALLTSCVGPDPANRGMGETAFAPGRELRPAGQEVTLTVHLAVNDIYCKQTACSCVHDIASREYHDVQKVLKEQFNIELQLSYFPEIYELEEPLAQRKFDGVIAKPWDAFRVAPEHATRYKRIADILDPDDNQWLQGIVMVRKDSSIARLQQLDGKRIALGQSDAYEKYHMPLSMLQAAGIKPAVLMQKASCLEATGALLDDHVDAAIVSDYVMTASCVVDIATPDDFRIIARTSRTPLTSVAVDLDRMSAGEILRLQRALLTVAGSKSPPSLQGGGFVEPAAWNPQPLPKQFALH